MALLATILGLVATVSIGGPKCAPDLITQAPLVCLETVSLPYRGKLPVRSDAEVTIAARYPDGWRALRRTGSSGCYDRLRSRGLRAVVDRCLWGLRVVIHRRDLAAPRRARIEALGSGL